MEFLFREQAVAQIQQLKIRYASGKIDGQGYKYARATILDHYMNVTDRQGNLSLMMNRLRRLNSFSPYLGQPELWEEEQRMWRQSHHPPIVPGRPMQLWPAPRPIPLLPSVFGRGSQQQEFIQLPPPHGLPAAEKPNQYVAIHPGTSMLTHAKAFLDNFFLPHQKRSKGGGQHGKLMFCYHRPGCALMCRLVSVPLSDPPLYKAEVKRCCREHTNHNALEDEPALHFSFLPLPDEVKLYIDQLVEVNPKTTPGMIMGCLLRNPSFANRPFLTDICRRADSSRKVKYYRSSALRANRKRSKQS
jgi:hypothetical protein